MEPGGSVAKPMVWPWADSIRKMLVKKQSILATFNMLSSSKELSRYISRGMRESNPTLPKDRVPYSAIVDRPTLRLPNNARIAVWTIVNVEEWPIERAMPRMVLSPPQGQPLLPDLPNWAWHEYGMRVGFWRLLEVLEKFDLKGTFALNGSVCRSYPRVAEAALKAGWEFMGHGYVQRPMHHVEDQKHDC